MNYSPARFKDISEIHPLAPMYAYTNKISSNGMNKHLIFLTYDKSKNDFVDVTEIVAKSFNKKSTQNGVLFSGTGIDAQTEYFERFKDAYQNLTSIEFKGKLEKFIYKEKHFIAKYAKDFLDLKENKLKYATSEQQNDAKFVYEAVKDCGCSVQYASKRLKNNKRIALAAINDDPSSFRFLGDKIKDNETYVAIAVEGYETGLRWASQRIIDAVGNNDAKSYFNSFLLHTKLNNNIKNSPHIKKIKI